LHSARAKWGFGMREFEEFLQYLGFWLIGESGSHKHHHIGIGMHGAGFCTAGPHHREIGCLRVGGCIAKSRDGTESSQNCAETGSLLPLCD
ncbi:MAG TPA: hypothetical protein VE970_03710, partial [Pseudolabrys sp.]|nr:hypothetical protein [Pseudolabrys sp.]